VLHIFDLGYGVHDLAQTRTAAAPGDDHALLPRTFDEGADHFLFIEIVKRQHIGEFVQDHQIQGIVRKHLPGLCPGVACGTDVRAAVLRIPGEARAHLVKVHGRAMVAQVYLLPGELLALDELHHAHFLPVAEGANHHAEG
jgi:hypothetical protein